jgi:hypothetical protein
MNKIIFSGPSHVEIQGDEVLRFISINPQMAVYELVSFEHIPVIIKDSRSFGLDAIKAFLDNGKLHEFAPKFNKPSQLSILEEEQGEIVIQLTETRQRNPAYMLWIAIGLQIPIPNYSFIFQSIVPYKHDKNALLSVYKRPYRKSTPTVSEAFFSPLDHILDNEKARL